MSSLETVDLQPLDKKLRGKLETAVNEARDEAEEAARAACHQLRVGRAKPDAHLTEDERALRRCEFMVASWGTSGTPRPTYRSWTG